MRSGIYRENQLTQEEFGKLFHVTRQTVSNWENGKSYPELQILVSISKQFDVSLDTLLKEDLKMVQSIDKERVMGIIKHEKSIVDFLQVPEPELLYPAYFHQIHLQGLRLLSLEL